MGPEEKPFEEYRMVDVKGVKTRKYVEQEKNYPLIFEECYVLNKEKANCSKCDKEMPVFSVEEHEETCDGGDS